METAATFPTLEHFERPEYLDRLELLRQSPGAVGRALGAAVSNLSGMVQLAVTVTLLGWVDPVLVLLPLFAVPSLLGSLAARRRLAAAEEATAEQHRLAEHLLDLAVHPGLGKELRVCGIERELMARHRTARAIVTRQRDSAEWKGAALVAGGWALFRPPRPPPGRCGDARTPAPPGPRHPAGDHLGGSRPVGRPVAEGRARSGNPPAKPPRARPRRTHGQPRRPQ